jgi:hypothetical protein
VRGFLFSAEQSKNWSTQDGPGGEPVIFIRLREQVCPGHGVLKSLRRQARFLRLQAPIIGMAQKFGHISHICGAYVIPWREIIPARVFHIRIIIRHMLGLTDNQLRTVMDTARQLPKLKFVALWGALTLTFAFPAQVFAAPEETITITTLLKGGWQIAGYTSTLDNRSAFILFRHPNEPYLVQCRASYDVTRTPSVTSNCYKLQ